MNLYAQIYHVDEIMYLIVVEGVYESRLIPKSRELVVVNLTDNKIKKLVKQPYDVLNIGDNTISLKKRRYDMNTHTITYEETYTTLSYLLSVQGYTQERIMQISNAINNISSNTNIKPNKCYFGENIWIDF